VHLMPTIMTAQTTRPISAGQLLEMGDTARNELILGEIVPMSPTGFEHGRITAKLARVIGIFVEERKLGIVVASETGFLIHRDPDSVLAPDVAFVQASRYVATQKYFEGAPDLAIEVMSPSDTWSEVSAKVEMWLAAGCRSCWVVDPKSKTITIFHGGDDVHRARSGETVQDDLVLSGLAIEVESIFAV